MLSIFENNCYSALGNWTVNCIFRHFHISGIQAQNVYQGRCVKMSQVTLNVEQISNFVDISVTMWPYGPVEGMKKINYSFRFELKWHLSTAPCMVSVN